MPNLTTRLSLQKPVGADVVSALRTAITTNASTLDNAALWNEGTLAARPAAASVVTGTFYHATDTGDVSYSNGSIWTSAVFPPTACRAYGGGQTLPGGGNSYVANNSIDFDIGSHYNVTTYRYTVAASGYYQVNGLVGILVQNNPQVFSSFIARNGAQVLGSECKMTVRGASLGTDVWSFPLSDLIHCNVNDYLQMGASNVSANAVTVNESFISIFRVA